MTNPYDIEEIFPDDDAGSVRLPRRQAGNSTQDLAVTLLADYTLRNRAWLPSAAIVALLGETGVSDAAARTAISRLARRGVLGGSRQGRRSSYRLTPAAATFLAVGGRSIVSTADDDIEPWDERWTLIAFSLPQEESVQRRGLRTQLRWMGFAPLFDGLWVSPRDLTEKAIGQLGRFAPVTMTVFRARHVDVATGLGRAPLHAWNIAAIARAYESFVQQWKALPPRIDTGQIAGAEAVQVRTDVMNTYRRLPILDPQLPLELLPPGWLRTPARNLFTAIYDGLATTAATHVRAIAARFTDASLPGIQAHTVADLAAGLAAQAERDVG